MGAHFGGDDDLLLRDTLLASHHTTTPLLAIPGFCSLSLQTASASSSSTVASALESLASLLPPALQTCVPETVNRLAANRGQRTYRFVTEWSGGDTAMVVHSNVDHSKPRQMAMYHEHVFEKRFAGNAADTAVTAIMSESGIHVKDETAASVVWKRDVGSGISVDNVQLLHRSVHKSGFHRELHSTVRARITGMKGAMFSGQCTCELVEQFPTSVYVDIYEIDQLLRVGSETFEMDLWNDFVDLEKPEPVSPPVFVSFRKKMHEVLVDVDGHIELIADMRVPIHLRYQQPIEVADDEQGNVTHRNVTIAGPAHIVIECAGRHHEVSMLDLNSIWDHLHSTESSSTLPAVHIRGFSLPADQSQHIVVQVPAGLVRDAPMVTLTTLAITIFGALLLSICSLTHKTTSSAVLEKE